MSVQDFLTSTFFSMGLFVIWLIALLAIYPFVSIVWKLQCLRHVRVAYRKQVRCTAASAGFLYTGLIIVFAEYLRVTEGKDVPWNLVPIFVEICLVSSLVIFGGILLHRRNTIHASPRAVKRITFIFYLLLFGFACLVACANGITDALEAKNENLLYYEQFNVGLICNRTFDDPSDIIEIERKPELDVLLPLAAGCATNSDELAKSSDPRCKSNKVSDFDHREKLVRALDKGLLTMRYKASDWSNGMLQFTPFETTSGFHSADLGQTCDCVKKHSWHFDWYIRKTEPSDIERCKKAQQTLTNKMSQRQKPFPEPTEASEALPRPARY
jgi:hypothetical protein